MDTRLKKWTNPILVTLVIIIMTLSGMYGLNALYKMGATGNNNFSLEQSEEVDYIQKTQISLFDKWAAKNADQAYSHNSGNHVSEDLLKKIKNWSSVKVKMKVKPYGKKMQTKTSIYGATDADITGSRVEKFHIVRDKTLKLNKDGSFNDWDGYEYDFNSDPRYLYDFSGDNYTLYNVFPKQLLISDEKEQRLESADIEISLTDKAIKEINTYYKEATKQITKGIKTVVIVSIIEVIGTILLCILFALQKNRTRFFKGLDKIWWEIIAVITFILIGLAIALSLADWEYAIDYAQGSITRSTIDMIMMLSYISVPFFILVFAPCVQTTIWRLKEKNLLDSTFFLGYIRKWYRKGKERRKLENEAMSFAEAHAKDRIKQYRMLRNILGIIAILSFCIVIMGIDLPAPLVVIVCAISTSLIKFFNKYSDKYAKEQRDLGKLVDQITRISNGELTATTDIDQDSDYYEYSQKLNHIGEGMEKALETQMKGERMKIDLITNVSHDLKTPLTSIIGYVDLLSKDETLSQESRDYVAILIKKTERLKDIISDLFELAKSTSGDVKVDLEEMDMKRLVEQTLGDMSDQIEEVGFEIRYQCEAMHTKFLGDSSRMYRVVQNVMENALKYSLQGTRIFIRITEEKDDLILNIINTASYEMNFTEEEIMERFARAEKSRTSEGNGLGLSIADSFTKNCGGKFAIAINGDQFMVTIQFKQYFKGNQ